MGTIILTPAYGRDYTNMVKVLADFYGGKDFVYNELGSPYDGKYCSVRDLKNGQQIKFRFKQAAESFYHTIKKED